MTKEFEKAIEHEIQENVSGVGYASYWYEEGAKFAYKWCAENILAEKEKNNKNGRDYILNREATTARAARRIVEKLNQQLAEKDAQHKTFLRQQAKNYNHHLAEKGKLLSEILDYCYPHEERMWAASIMGKILGCDFIDAKREYEKLKDGEDV